MKNIFILLFFCLPFLATAQLNEGVLLGTWDDPELPGSNAYDNTYNEIWGYAIADKEYAILGSTMGTHIIDVTDANNPTEVFFVEGGTAGGQVIHRDYDDYQGYLYAVCDEGSNSTLQIIDLSDLPNSIDVVYDSNELIRRAHNIFIDKAAGRMYALATDSPSGYNAMKVFDLTDPVAPTLMGGFNTFGGNTVGHVHDAYVKNNIAYLNCGYDGLFVVDFSVAANPMLLGSLTDYLMSGYNHSGWASEDGSYYYFADENHGMDIKAVDVTNLSDLSVNLFFNAGDQGDNNSIAHNQVVAGDYLYVSYYYDGVQVYDISDPANPVHVLYYDTSTEPNTLSYKGAWGVYPFLPSGNILVSDMQEGLFVIEGIETETSSTTTPDGSVLLEIFPQPAKEQLNINIQMNKTVQNAQLQLVDLMGRTLHAETINLGAGNNELTLHEINALTPGYYILKVQGSDWELAERVIVGK